MLQLALSFFEVALRSSQVIRRQPISASINRGVNRLARIAHLLNGSRNTRNLQDCEQNSTTDMDNAPMHLFIVVIETAHQRINLNWARQDRCDPIIIAP